MRPWAARMDIVRPLSALVGVSGVSKVLACSETNESRKSRNMVLAKAQTPALIVGIHSRWLAPVVWNKHVQTQAQACKGIA